jgi:hypothetical protein
MESLKNTKLWALLRDLVANVDCPNTDSLLDNFAGELSDFCRNEKSIAERARALGYARSEIVAALGDSTSKGTKKKCAFA